jgi:hypothetical protein
VSNVSSARQLSLEEVSFEGGGAEGGEEGGEVGVGSPLSQVGEEEDGGGGEGGGEAEEGEQEDRGGEGGEGEDTVSAMSGGRHRLRGRSKVVSLRKLVREAEENL